MNSEVRKILKGIAKRKKRKLNTDDPFEAEKMVSGKELPLYLTQVTARARCLFRPLLGTALTRKKCIEMMQMYFEASLIQEDDLTLVFDVDGNPPIRTLQICMTDNGILEDFFFCK